MVALHNRKLTAPDIWPDILWTDTDRAREESRLRAELTAQGLEGPRLIFALARAMEDYQRPHPEWRERQAIMARLYPATKTGAVFLTQEEIDWLTERLHGVNEEIGQSILSKLAALPRP